MKTHLMHVTRVEIYEVAVEARSDEEAKELALDEINQASDLSGYYLSTKEQEADIAERWIDCD